MSSEPTDPRIAEKQRKNLRKWVVTTINVFVAPLGVTASAEAIDTLTQVIECRAKELAEQRLEQVTAERDAYRRAISPCEAHTPDVWEGDGTCVICEAVHLHDAKEAAEATIASLPAALRSTFTNEVIRAIGALARQQDVCREQGGAVAFVTGMEAAREYIVEHVSSAVSRTAERRECAHGHTVRQVGCVSCVLVFRPAETQEGGQR